MSRKLSEAQIWLHDYLRDRYENWTVCCEYQFSPPRRWRFDIAWWDGMHPLTTLHAIEIEGGIWNNGAHVRGKHFESDMEKYNTAVAQGWRLFRFTPDQVLRGAAREFIEENYHKVEAPRGG